MINQAKSFARDLAVMLIGAAVLSVGFNLFLIPHQIISGGMSGVAMLIGYITKWNIGWLYLALNVPIFIWGWRILGKRFVALSILSVVATSVALLFIPVHLFNQDPLTASVFGGVLVGLGTGLSLRFNGSTGGFDIVASIILRRHDFPLGQVLFVLNGAVILILGLTQQNWDLALYSVISIFVTGKVIDVIHTRHVKFTAFIVSSKKEEMLKRLRPIPRGVTVLQAQGAYSGKERHVFMIVATRYELHTLMTAVREVDPDAFVNLVDTVGVYGLFRRE